MQQSKWSTWESQLCCCTCGGFCQEQQVVSRHCTLCACPTQVMYVHWHSISDNAAAVCAGTVNLTQTHPAAPYVCRTGNITLRCQYDGVENVLNVVWNVDDMVNLDFDSMTLPGHTALDQTDSHQDLVIASFVDLRGTYMCTVVSSANLTNSPRLSPGPVEGNHWYHTLQEIFMGVKLCNVPTMC